MRRRDVRGSELRIWYAIQTLLKVSNSVPTDYSFDITHIALIVLVEPISFISQNPFPIVPHVAGTVRFDRGSLGVGRNVVGNCRKLSAVARAVTAGREIAPHKPAAVVVWSICLVRVRSLQEPFPPARLRGRRWL